ncbi:MAG: YkgJ family cysteine cluster protein [Acidiferrobacterales bacterium]
MPDSSKRPKFKCTGCGKCCTGNPRTHFIELTTGEAEKIQRSLNIGRSWFYRRYLEVLGEQTWGIRIGKDKRCVFLDKKKACRIYQTRPQQCRSYPYWPEILGSRSAWQNESRRCEGIGLGNLIAKKYRKNF